LALPLGAAYGCVLASSSLLSKSQIDRLGERLKVGDAPEQDLRQLDEYRRSFDASYSKVVGKIRDVLRFEPTGRPQKSTSSIVEKLERESIRLSQMQDIAGCRLVVIDVVKQDEVVNALSAAFRVVMSLIAAKSRATDTERCT
jgi:ppGpp synthetase/RelA/SpoT-type nucleotidyltranferase